MRLAASEVEEYRRGDRPVQLTHAVRALDDMRQQVQLEARYRQHVESAQNRGQ